MVDVRSGLTGAIQSLRPLVIVALMIGCTANRTLPSDAHANEQAHLDWAMSANCPHPVKVLSLHRVLDDERGTVFDVAYTVAYLGAWSEAKSNRFLVQSDGTVLYYSQKVGRFFGVGENSEAVDWY